MYNVVYYNKNNEIPVLNFITQLPRKDQAKILREIDLLEIFGLSLGFPHIKKINSKENIWELRIKHSSNHYRIFYFTLSSNEFLLLNAIHKKTNKLNKKDIDLSIKRKRDYLNRKK